MMIYLSDIKMRIAMGDGSFISEEEGWKVRYPGNDRLVTIERINPTSKVPTDNVKVVYLRDGNRRQFRYKDGPWFDGLDVAIEHWRTEDERESQRRKHIGNMELKFNSPHYKASSYTNRY